LAISGETCDEILKAGIIVADVSSVNLNVFYELGLVHALGKDTLLLKEQGSTLPVDFRGELYCQYHLDRLDEAQVVLCERLKRWKKGHCCDGVAAITRA
jgi:predicted nucleotide-binding protein